VMAHGNNAREFTLMVENGLAPMQAILAGTSNAADLLGWGNRVGTVQVDRLADLVAVRGDPLSDISVLETVSVVIMNGRIVVDNRD